jgi:hypothetical protein
LVSRVLHDIVQEVTPVIRNARDTAIKVLSSIARFSLGSMPQCY